MTGRVWGLWVNRTPAVHIGDNDGRIALWLNEQSAYDLAAMMRSDDLGSIELVDAAVAAYPPDDEDEA